MNRIEQSAADRFSHSTMQPLDTPSGAVSISCTPVAAVVAAGAAGVAATVALIVAANNGFTETGVDHHDAVLTGAFSSAELIGAGRAAHGAL